MKYIIDRDGNITGRSFCEEIEGIEAPHKPLREDESCRWNGSEWEYKFRDYPPITEIPSIPTEENLCKDSIKYLVDVLTDTIRPNVGVSIFEDNYRYKEGQKLTTLIPCWGKAKYIESTLQSLLSNSMLPDKVIILLMDEDSIALKGELEAMSSIIECIEHERLDVASARNYLATLADSEWLMFLDADDLVDRYYIEALLKYEEPNSFNAAIRASLARKYDLIKQEYLSEVTDPDNRYGLLRDIIRCTGSFICHKDIMQDYKFKPECNNACEDTCFYMDILKDHKYVSYLSYERMLTYRIHTDTSLCDQEDYDKNWVKTAEEKILPICYEQLIRLPDFYLGKNNLYPEATKNIIDNKDYTLINSLLLNKCSYRKYSNDLQKTILSYCYNSITGLFKESRERKPLEPYSKENFTVIGKVPEYLDLEGIEFDVLIFNDIYPHNATDIFYKQGNMLINNKCLDKIMQMDTIYSERLVYLLKNYCVICFGDLPEEETNLLSIEKQFHDVIRMYNLCSFKEKNELLDSYLSLITKMVFEAPIKKPTHYITFSLNRTCNQKCAYCNQLKADNINEDKIYENFDRYLTKAEEAYGVKVFPQLLGGEPTLLSHETQIKILGRLKEYPMIMLFTNGYDKTAPLYMHPNVIKNVHAMTLEQAAELIKELKKPDLTVYVATKSQLPEIEQWLEDNRELVKNSFQLIPCMNTGNTEYDCGEEELVKIAQLTKEYNLNDFASPELTEVILQQRFDIARTQCPKKTSTLQIDCITGKVLPCCNYAANVSVDIEEFDFNDTAKYLNAEACKKCLTLSNYTR